MTESNDKEEQPTAAPGAPAAPLQRQVVLYCGSCGMPPEYCEYGPDYETHCDVWLKLHHPLVRQEIVTKRMNLMNLNKSNATNKGKKSSATLTGATTPETDTNTTTNKVEKVLVERPWTTLERLVAFYEKYEPSKIDGASALLDKYKGKEDQLFIALEKKYGPEPDDPYYIQKYNITSSVLEEQQQDPIAIPENDEDEDEDDDDNENDGNDDDGNNNTTTTGLVDKKKRRGVSANNTTNTTNTTSSTSSNTSSNNYKVIVQKQTQKRKRCLTIITGLEHVSHTIKLKDIAKVMAKKFAGSSSVKDNTIIIQGDHIYDVAELIVDQFHIPIDKVYLDLDGSIVPLK